MRVEVYQDWQEAMFELCQEWFKNSNNGYYHSWLFIDITKVISKHIKAAKCSAIINQFSHCVFSYKLESISKFLKCKLSFRSYLMQVTQYALWLHVAIVAVFMLTCLCMCQLK